MILEGWSCALQVRNVLGLLAERKPWLLSQVGPESAGRGRQTRRKGGGRADLGGENVGISVVNVCVNMWLIVIYDNY